MSPLPPSFDSIDRRILDRLQRDARTSNAELARDLGMAPSAVLERLRKLESRGVLTGYEARIAPRAIGLGLIAFVYLRVEERAGGGDTSRALLEIPEVQELHLVAGEDGYLAKLRARDIDDLARILREGIAAIPTIRSTRTTIVLETRKETAQLPLHQLEPEAEPRPRDPFIQ